MGARLSSRLRNGFVRLPGPAAAPPRWHIPFTRKDAMLYAILLGQPKPACITIQSWSLNPGAKITIPGQAEPFSWSAQGADTIISLPRKFSGEYGFTLKIIGSGL